MMNNYYDANRQKEIMDSLSGEKLLLETELTKIEELPAYQSFADALLHNIPVPENDDTRPLEINHLAAYLQRQAENLGLADDHNVSYAIEQVDRLSRKIYALKKGAEGEVLAKRAMFGINAPNQILTNMEFTMNGLPFEADTIVINAKGICVVEVKNIHRNLVIDENGTLVATDGSNRTYCNVKMQLNNAATVVRRVLEQSFPDNSKLLALAEHIHTVLFTADGSIIDSRREITVADRNSIARILNDLPGRETLTKDEIDMVADALKSAAQQPCYPLNYDYVRVAKAIATAVAKLEYAAEHNPAKQFLDCLSGKKEAEDFAEPDADEFSGESDSAVFAPKKKRRYKKIAKKVATSAASIALLGVGLLLSKRKF